MNLLFTTETKLKILKNKKETYMKKLNFKILSVFLAIAIVVSGSGSRRSLSERRSKRPVAEL